MLEDLDALIMSPGLFSQRAIREPADVEGHALLASETRAGDWLDAAGLSRLGELPRQMFDHFFVTRQAVEDGLGIGIGPLPMLEIDIAAGRLMTPLPDIQIRRTGYVALVPRHTDEASFSTMFVDWLAAEGKRHPPDL